MKKRFLAVVIGCVLCSMATGCGSSVNAEPSNITYTEAETTTGALVLMETGASTEADTEVGTDVFEKTALDLSNIRTVSIFSVADDDEDAEDEFAIQVYSDAEKKINEFSYSYEYEFDGGKYKVEVSDDLKKNVSQNNCDWMTAYSEVSNYIDGTKCPQQYATIDCSINDKYEMVYVHIENPEYAKDKTLLEDRYYIKDNVNNTLDLIVVSVVRDTTVYGEGSMPVTRQYMADMKDDIYAEFSR